jgi:rare lipoprotein A
VTRRANPYVVVLLLVSGSALMLPQSGWASSGGTGLAPVQTTAPPVASGTHASSTAGAVQSGNMTESASGNGITVAARAAAILRNQLAFTGSVPPSAAGDTVEIERLGRQTGWAWAPTTHGTAHANGSFTAVWPANHIGQFAIRAVIDGRGGVISRAAGPSATLTVTVYRPAIATWYGPGFYGSTTACGETLKPQLLGVANRTLKCGTKVAIYYHGRTMVVPVIDRGPYANHADWDLTEATARALGTDGISTIGAVSLPAK